MSACDFSVCIPSYNRSKEVSNLIDSLAEAISALKNLDQLSPVLEVLICLDGSTDGSGKSIEERIPDFPCSLRYFWKENGGLASARNSLTSRAKGRIVWLLDDDMIVSKQALATHLAFEHLTQNILVGPCNIAKRNNVKKFYDIRWQEVAENGFVITKPEQMSFANTSFDKSILEMHPFSVDFKGYGFEDYELAIRLLTTKYKIHFSWEAGVVHRHNKTLFQTLISAHEEGINRVKLYRLHPVKGEFALSFVQSNFMRKIKNISDKKMHWLLFSLAFVLYGMQVITWGGLSQRFRNLSISCALHSGIAKEGGKTILV